MLFLFATNFQSQILKVFDPTNNLMGEVIVRAADSTVDGYKSYHPKKNEKSVQYESLFSILYTRGGMKSEKIGFNRIGIIVTNKFDNISKIGKWVYWNSAHQKEAEMYYSNDTINGIIKEWHANGIVKLTAKYKNGLLDSIYTEWNDRGIITCKALYKLGKKNEYFTCFDSNGVKTYQSLYKDDELIQCTYYYSNSYKKEVYHDVRSTKNYQSDTTWHENGVIAGVKKYDSENNLQKFLYWNMDKRLIYLEEHSALKSYTHKYWYNNGTPELIMQFEHDSIKTNIGWYENGKQSHSINFNGKMTRWFESGILSEQGEYKNGNPEGKWTQFDYLEHKISEGNYLNGEKNGTWLHWENNVLKEEIVYNNSGAMLSCKKLLPNGEIDSFHQYDQK